MAASTETLAYACVLAASLLHALGHALLKAADTRIFARFSISGSCGLALAPALLLFPAPEGALRWLALSVAIKLAHFHVLIRLYRSSDFSAAFPVARGVAPLGTALLAALLLGDPARPDCDWTESAVCAGGLLLMCVGRHLSRAGVAWALAAGSLTVGYTLVDAQGVRAAAAPMAYVVWMFVALGATVLLQLGAAKALGRVKGVGAEWRLGLLAGGLTVLTYGVALVAFRYAPAGPVAALRETSVLFGALIAAVWLKERVGPARVGAAALIVAGTALILLKGG